MADRTVGAIVKVGCCGFAAAQAKYYATFPVVEVQQTFYPYFMFNNAPVFGDAQRFQRLLE